MKTLRFKLDVVITSSGEIVGADLRVRDMLTRKSESVCGFSGDIGERLPHPLGDRLDTVLRAVRLVCENHQEMARSKPAA